MLISMTGFGRSVSDTPFGRLITEIQSVNRKYLEMFISMPKEFGRFEQAVRKWVGEKVARGQISIRIHLIPSEKAAADLLPDVKMLRGLQKGWKKIAKELGCNPKQIDLPFLMLHSPMQQKVQFAQDEDLQEIEKAFKEALEALLKMKRSEGNALASDIVERVALLEKHLKAIEKAAPQGTKRMQEKLVEKLKEAKFEGSALDERLMREVLLFAEKVDITEEITRLLSHFRQFRETVRQPKEAVGRKLDFLVQEIGREINTIGSKSLDADISHLVVEMKSGLEKIREQIQNIE